MRRQPLEKSVFNQIPLKISGPIIFCLILISFANCSAQIREILPPLKDLAPPIPLPGDVIPPPQPEPEPIPFSERIFQFFRIFWIDYIVNAFVLIIGYSILRQLVLIKSLKFILYLFFVTIGGALIDLIFVAGVYLSQFGGTPTYPNTFTLFAVAMWCSLLLTTLCLTLYNYWLSRKFFNLTKKQAIFIGVIVGIFTNPLLSLLLQNYPDLISHIISSE